MTDTVAPVLCASFFHGSVNRNIENRLASFFGIHTRHKTLFAVGVFLAFFSMELTGLA